MLSDLSSQEIENFLFFSFLFLEWANLDSNLLWLRSCFVDLFIEASIDSIFFDYKLSYLLLKKG